MQTTTNQIRNILMNELGLTRESVRELMTQIVVETVDKKFESLRSSGDLDRIMSRAFTDRYGSRLSAQRFLTDAATEVAREFFKEKLEVTLKE